MVKTIGNPLTWSADAVRGSTQHIGAGAAELASQDTRPITLQKITTGDLKDALKAGFEDFSAMRTDVMFVVMVYPLIGLFLTLFALNRDMLALIFPLTAGFALMGPAFAVGLYEMSRRRQLGEEVTWGSAFRVIGSPSFIPIVVLSFALGAIFIAWMLTAQVLYNVTLGPTPPASVMAFLADVLGTVPGLVMLVVGVSVGAVFAVIVLAVSVISFPMLLDRSVGVPRAVAASVQLAKQNPVVVATWGAIVVVLLGLGTVTLFVGLVFSFPILGHATWHLYKRATRDAEV